MTPAGVPAQYPELLLAVNSATTVQLAVMAPVVWVVAEVVPEGQDPEILLNENPESAVSVNVNVPPSATARSPEGLIDPPVSAEAATTKELTPSSFSPPSSLSIDFADIE